MPYGKCLNLCRFQELLSISVDKGLIDSLYLFLSPPAVTHAEARLLVTHISFGFIIVQETSTFLTLTRFKVIPQKLITVTDEFFSNFS